MKDSVLGAWITASTSLVVAMISGGVTLWTRSKTDKNSQDVQRLQGAIDGELEGLRARLAHGQTVSATQWNVEFSAYQAIWKAIVDVRPLADKLATREERLRQLGLPEKYLNDPARLQILKDLVEKASSKANDLLSAIHDNAPFYPARIRNAANEAHQATNHLVFLNLSAITEAMKGNNRMQSDEFDEESKTILIEVIRPTEEVESLIRERLAEVQVAYPIGR